MKIIGVLLLVSGWLLVLSTLVMLRAGVARTAFIAAGLGVEALGFAIMIRPPRAEQSK